MTSIICLKKQVKRRTDMDIAKIVYRHVMGFLAVMSPQAMVVMFPIEKYKVQRYWMLQCCTVKLWPGLSPELQTQQQLGVLGPQKFDAQTWQSTAKKPTPSQCPQSSMKKTILAIAQKWLRLKRLRTSIMRYLSKSQAEITLQINSNLKQLLARVRTRQGTRMPMKESRSSQKQRPRQRRKMAYLALVEMVPEQEKIYLFQTRIPFWQQAFNGPSRMSPNKNTEKIRLPSQKQVSSSCQKDEPQPVSIPVYTKQYPIIASITTFQVSTIRLQGLSTRAPPYLSNSQESQPSPQLAEHYLQDSDSCCPPTLLRLSGWGWGAPSSPLPDSQQKEWRRVGECFYFCGEQNVLKVE